MGLLWRLFAPKPLKKARRALHPSWVIEDAIVHSVRKGRRQRRRRAAQQRRAPGPRPQAEVPRLVEYVAQLTDTGTGQTWRCSHDHITERDASRCADAMEERIGRLGWEEATSACPQPSAANLEKTVALRTGQAPDRRRALQASEAERWASQQARAAARRERRAAAKTARGPWRWPEWVLTGVVIGFAATFVLAGIGGNDTGSAAALSAGGLGLASIAGAAVAGPTVLWRRFRARRAAAAMLAAAARDQAEEP